MHPNYDRYLESEELKEERAMETEEVRGAKFDQQKARHIGWLLNSYIYRPKMNPQSSTFQYEVWQDWLDYIGSNTIELVRLNLACGDREKAGMVLIESLEEYMDEIAARAVRERNNE